MKGIQTLPGFREFFPHDCSVRNYLFGKWRDVAARYGFVEYEAPCLEPADLYRKKSGDEIVEQLFYFVDKGEREVALRPELTPSLARMVAARQREYRKPFKWFSIGQFFRYEKPGKGRTREFYQLNCDIIGDNSPAADAEMIAFAIDVMRALGFSENEFVVRVSDRNAWIAFMDERGIAESRREEFLRAVDKLEREPEEKLEAALDGMPVCLNEVKAFVAGEGKGSLHFAELEANLKARRMEAFYELDLSIVRGLAYYTGTVFEIFDTGRSMRAVAGGGRYDNLITMLSDGAADLPAIGFGMGDVVIGNLIKETPGANRLLTKHLADESVADVYVIVASEENRGDALEVVQSLREAGFKTDYGLSRAKMGKQFQAAEALKARCGVIIGSEFPAVKVKNLLSREEREVPSDELAGAVGAVLAAARGPMIAKRDGSL